MGEFVSVRISKKTKKRLDERKIHYKEPYEDVVKRLLDGKKYSKQT